MAPSKRRKTSAAGRRTPGDASSEVASVSVPARAPPGNLVCPISFNMFRDPVMVVESGHTYDRNEITQHFAHNNRDPKTNLHLRSTRVVTNWGVRAAVEEWLNRHPDVTPDGWDSRELLPVQVEAPVQTAEPGHGDALVLQMWRDMCPELQAIWEVDRPVEQWRGVTMVDGRVVSLDLSGKSLSQVVPACIGRLTALKALALSGNQLTSVPAEIGQLASLEWLNLSYNQLTSVPAEIGQLTSLKSLYLEQQSADERAGGDRAARVATAVEPQRQSADELAGGDRAAHVAEGVDPQLQSADERAGGDRAAHIAGEVVPRGASAEDLASGNRRAGSEGVQSGLDEGR